MRSEGSRPADVVVRGRWSADDDERLVRLRADGMTYSAIAPQLGRSTTACRNRLRALALNGSDDARALLGAPRIATPWTARADRDLLQGYAAGRTVATLAAALGRTPHETNHRIAILSRRGVELPPRRPRWSEERRAALARRRHEGATLRELEREFEITRGTLTSQLRRLRREGLVA